MAVLTGCKFLVFLGMPGHLFGMAARIFLFARNAGLILLGCGYLSVTLIGAELGELQKMLAVGQYARAIEIAEQGVSAGTGEEEWPLVLGQTLLTVGRYTNAQQVMTAALEQFPFSLRLRLLAREVAQFNNRPTQAEELLEEVGQLVNRRPWAYRDAPNLVALGRAALLLGSDPKKVLENTFDRARKTEPGYREAHIASAGVALEKNDPELAAKLLAVSLKAFPGDADLLSMMAKAYSSSDRKVMLTHLAEALEKNENHIPSYLLLADHLIDAEDYDEAGLKLAQILKVNPNHPEAWALRAVISHLRNQGAQEQKDRAQALAFYPQNPEVDHVIGRKLSQKYRFTEGAAYQQRALSLAPTHLPSRSQLAQDLLRLGRDEEGWALVEKVFEDDGYDVVAYNLASLKDILGKFTTLTNADFIVRMGKEEAPVYGERVMALLSRAHAQLCEKYGIRLEGPTLVEIFPDQKDFAVRTFGMPGGAGYLGVCFGRVITANSPATQSGKAASWESVLWHEFCHVVTLQMTRNKMPRWLSEGISVYEELQSNPTWGQTMTPRYREMILGKDLRKIGDLSAAFMAPPSGEHLMFAYFQSYLVVRFVVEKYGIESLRHVLKEIKAGEGVNEALARHTAALDTLETDFAAYARKQAEALAPQLEWNKPEPADLAWKEGVPSEWARKNPKNYYVLSETGRQLVRARKWQEAEGPLRELIQAFPSQVGPQSAYALLAQTYRGSKQVEAERQILTRWASLDSNATEAYLRLMELALQQNDWLIVVENAERFLAVNPLSPHPYLYLAKAAEFLGRPTRAVQAYQTLLRLDPADPAGAHFGLARLLTSDRPVDARRHVLRALEETPRYQEAHRLLLELSAAVNPPPPPAR